MVRGSAQVKRKLAAVDSKLEYFWGLTLYHRDDITFDIADTPCVACYPPRCTPSLKLQLYALMCSGIVRVCFVPRMFMCTLCRDVFTPFKNKVEGRTEVRRRTALLRTCRA